MEGGVGGPTIWQESGKESRPPGVNRRRRERRTPANAVVVIRAPEKYSYAEALRDMKGKIPFEKKGRR